MVFRNDYILRMIDEMTQMVAKVLALKQDRKHIEALWEIDEQLSKQFRLNSRLVDSLTVKDIMDMHSLQGIVEAEQLQGIALLLHEEGKVKLEMGDREQGLKSLLKGLHLFLYAEQQGADSQAFQLDQRVDEIMKEWKGYVLPSAVDELLLSYEEKRGRYAEAENVLHRLLSRGAVTDAAAISFYERLLSVDDELLAAGGLPREEVLEGLSVVSSPQVIYPDAVQE